MHNFPKYNIPAILIGCVYTSCSADRVLLSSDVNSLYDGGSDKVVGVSNTSTPLEKIVLKSSDINLLNFWALMKYLS